MSNPRYVDNEKNSPFKRGIVVDRKPGKVKVKFDDEDEDQSTWLSVGQSGSASNKMFNMPDIGDQIGCLVDWDGEDGMTVGTIYSEKDATPTNDMDNMHFSFPKSGVSIIVGKTSGDVTVSGANNVLVQATNVSIEAPNIKLEGDIETLGTITNNGVNIGSDHKHKDVEVGGGLSGEPV